MLDESTAKILAEAIHYFYPIRCDDDITTWGASELDELALFVAAEYGYEVALAGPDENAIHGSNSEVEMLGGQDA